ncbi:MAG TPA: MarR family transcriptional regulator [Ktedonobacteraceae bacterium]
MASERLVEDLFSLSRLLRPGRDFGMTPQQYWLLRQLSRDGSLSIGALAQELGITTGSATMACKRLERACLVTRVRQERDERVVRVALTEQGRALIDDLRQKKRAALAQWLDVLEETEQEELLKMVTRLLAAAGAQE